MGAVAYAFLPVASMPTVDFPTISVTANRPGADPEIMAATVAAPLERRLGEIPGVTEMTSRSSLGMTRITLQFDLNRRIDGAARDVQSAINAAQTDLPTDLQSQPTFRKSNPNTVPIMILALTSSTKQASQLYDIADTVVLLRYFEAQGQVRQAISVMKKRGGEHERSIREFRMEGGRIQVGPPLRNFRGILTGVPVLEDGARGERS